jgi:molecular chaperone HtpG
MSTHKFQTEVNDLLKLIIHSLYSHKEIFLRELVSNASDAIHKLKFLSLSDEKLKALEFNPRIDVYLDSEGKKIVVSDNGVGMNEQDLVEHLGTIARSGTRNFLEKLKAEGKNAAGVNDLIGQFGVGFYSAFMAADRIEVLTRKAGEDKAWLWSSTGAGEFDIAPAEREGHGTSVRLYLNEEGLEFADRWRTEEVLKKYSNHVSFPVFVSTEETDGKDKKKKELKSEQVNAGSALWKRPRTELKDEDYDEFYKSVFHDGDAPMLRIHTSAEGTLEYSTLFFVPKKAPADLYNADYSSGVKLYVRRVFIMDDSKELLPVYLRFVRGVIDSEDLPLNVSREILQHNRVFGQIRSASVKKLLIEFQKLSENADAYAAFWAEYGRPLKEGLFQDFENRDALLELMRFRSMKSGKLVSLAEYAKGMLPDQKEIYYIAGRKDMNLAASPLLEGYKARNLDVLIMDDEIDELVIPMTRKYKDHEFRSVNRSGDEAFEKDLDKKQAEELKPFAARMKELLKDEVKDVVFTGRLKDSPCCLTADKNDPSLHMQTLMRAMGGKDPGAEVKPILEVNPSHALVRLAAACKDEARQSEAVHLLFEEALLLEGGRLKDATGFASRLNRLLEKALSN